MKPILKIFVAEHCSGCNEALAVATGVRRDYPHFDVEVIDIGNPKAVVPEMIFAVPTYMLNNRIVSMGNPGPEQIARWLTEV